MHHCTAHPQREKPCCEMPSCDLHPLVCGYSAYGGTSYDDAGNTAWNPGREKRKQLTWGQFR